MAVRNESVRLSLQDDFTTGMARAAASAAVLKKNLNDLDGKRVSRELDDTSRGIDNVDRSSRRAGPNIDRFSGRLRLLTDAAVTLGPALIPLGAGILPALTASVAGLGAAAGGIATTVLAFNGLGDALKALNDYQLEPTAENLQKLRIEQEKLGPAGAHFVRFLDDLEPALRDVQNVARDGMLPGVEDGITAMLDRLPQVRTIIADLADGMGDLSREAGESLSSDTWTPFFDYLESDARPTLEAFSKATGNVALGLANLLVAFAPLNRDFTGGLQEATAAFAEWTAGLDENRSFQEFLAYVRENGPRAADHLAALGKAVAGMLEAAAPWGAAVLPTMTAALEIFAAIASSDAGPALFAAAAGLLAFNRAAAITAKVGPAVVSTFQGLTAAKIGQAAASVGLLAVAMSDLDDKAGLTNTTMGAFAGSIAGGPVGLAVGAAIGGFLDLKDASDEFAASVEQAHEAIRSGDFDTLQEELARLRAEYERTQEVLDPSGLAEGAKASFLGLSAGGLAFLDITTRGARDTASAIDSVRDAMRSGGDVADLFAETIGRTGDQLRTAAGDAAAFSGALAELAGWLDKRAAVRGYRDAIDELRKSLKDGFTREDAANLDAIGTSVLKVAENIKSPKIRGDFLAGAREQLVNMAENAGPRAAAAIQQVIDKFDQVGLTSPEIEITADNRRAQRAIDEVQRDLDILGRSTAEPEIDANDNPFRDIYGSVRAALREADRARANPTVSVDPGRSFDILSQLRSGLASLVSKTITVTVRRVGSALPQFADGGYTGPGQRDEPAGIVHRGEVVLPQPIVRRDWSMLKARYGDLPGFAEGGLVQNTYARTSPESREASGRDRATLMFINGLEDAAAGLKGLKALLEETRTQLEKERDARKSLIEASKAFAAQVGGAYATADPFAGSLADFDLANQANTNDTLAAQAALAAAAANGLNGPLYQALAASGNLALLQQFAGLSAAEIAQREQQYGMSQQVQSAFGNQAAQREFGAAIRDSNKAVRELRNEVRHLARAVDQMPDKVKDGAREGSHEGTKAGTEGKARLAQATRRTQGRPLVKP